MGNHLKLCDYQQKLRQFSINKGSRKKILFIGKAFKKMALFSEPEDLITFRKTQICL
jgi:hypothetical protein